MAQSSKIAKVKGARWALQTDRILGDAGHRQVSEGLHRHNARLTTHFMDQRRLSS